MASGRLMGFRDIVCLVIVLAGVSVADADVATFEDLALPAESCWNGSDGSGGFGPTSAITTMPNGAPGTAFPIRISPIRQQRDGPASTMPSPERARAARPTMPSVTSAGPRRPPSR